MPVPNNVLSQTVLTNVCQIFIYILYITSRLFFCLGVGGCRLLSQNRSYSKLPTSPPAVNDSQRPGQLPAIGSTSYYKRKQLLPVCQWLLLVYLCCLSGASELAITYILV
jgi:hypothetical protein